MKIRKLDRKGSTLVRIQRNRANGMCVCVCMHIEREREREREERREKDIYIRELAHATVEAGKSKIYRAARDPGKGWCFSWVQRAIWRQNYSFPWGPQYFSSQGLQQIGWDPLTLQRVICFTQSLLIEMLISCKKKYLQSNIQTGIWSNI